MEFIVKVALAIFLGCFLATEALDYLVLHYRLANYIVNNLVSHHQPKRQRSEDVAYVTRIVTAIQDALRPAPASATA